MARTGINPKSSPTTTKKKSAGKKESPSQRRASRLDKQLAGLLQFDLERFEDFVRQSADPLSFMQTARLSMEVEGQIKLFSSETRCAIIGVDEVGRGCLAGPVVAGAVMLPGFERSSEIAERLAQLDDSKKLSATTREDLAKTITGCAHYAVGEASPEEIDEINIFHASLLAMKRAVLKLVESAMFDLKNMLILIDGNRALPDFEANMLPVIKGDTKSASIAAASVVAKVHRDGLMSQLAEEFPQYNWKSNKGYPSAVHREAIVAHGMTPWHRRSFRCILTEDDFEIQDYDENGEPILVRKKKGSKKKTDAKNSVKAKKGTGAKKKSAKTKKGTVAKKKSKPV